VSFLEYSKCQSGNYKKSKASHIQIDRELHVLSEYIFRSVINFVYRHNNFEKWMKKWKKNNSDEFDDDGTFIVLVLFFIE